MLRELRLYPWQLELLRDVEFDAVVAWCEDRHRQLVRQAAEAKKAQRR